MEKKQDIALLLLRLGFGGAMLYGHGWGKLLRFFGEDPIKFSDPFGIGPVPSLVLVTFAEFFCSILIIFGLFTRWATIPLIIAMLVAVFYAHLDDPFSNKEKALLYLLTFVSLYFTGPGIYSIDEKWHNRNV